MAKTTRDPDRAGGGMPVHCVWEVTLRCDQACVTCGSRAGQARKDELSTAKALETVGQLATLGVNEVTLIGGEAYLREDWDIIAGAITGSGMVCNLVTGARGLDRDRIGRAERAGVVSVSISLDGLQASHDVQRGRGSFERALEAMGLLQESSLLLTNNTQINRLSVSDLWALGEVLVAYQSRSWQLQLTVPMGRGADASHLLLQPFELEGVFESLLRVKQELLDPSGVTLFLGNNIGYYSPYESLLRPFKDQVTYWQGCHAGEYVLGLEADGVIKGCPSLPTKDYSLGNLRTETLLDLFKDRERVLALQTRTVEDLWGFCRTCYYASECLGGCTWMAHSLFGRPGNNPYCIHRVRALSKLGQRERLRMSEGASGDPFDHGLFELEVEAVPLSV